LCHTFSHPDSKDKSLNFLHPKFIGIEYPDSDIAEKPPDREAAACDRASAENAAGSTAERGKAEQCIEEFPGC
jgi:hypothetical protein